MIHYESRGAPLQGISIAFLVLNWITFATRAWVRFKFTKRLWFDDWMLLVSMICYNFYVGLCIRAEYFGLGRNPVDPKVKDLHRILELWYFSDIAYILTSTTLRFGAGEQLTRHANRLWQRRLIFFASWTNIIFGIYMLFVSIFRCRPISEFWVGPLRMHAPNTSCNYMLAQRSMYVQSALGALMDSVFSLLPLFIAKKEGSLEKRQKWAVWATVLLGQIPGIAMVARIPAVVKLEDPMSWTLYAADVIILGSIEVGVGTFALCLASLSPIIFFLGPTASRHQDHQGDPNHFFQRKRSLDGYSAHDIELQNDMGNVTTISGPQRNKSSGSSKSSSSRLSKSLGKGMVENPKMSITATVSEHKIMKTTAVETFFTDDPRMSKALKPGSIL